MKRGVSNLIATVLLTLIVVTLTSTLFIFLKPLIQDSLEEAQISSQLVSERVSVNKVNFNGNYVTIDVERGKSNLDDYVIEISEVVVSEDADLDIVLVTDRSGSMRQAGWNAEINVPSSYDFYPVNVPTGSYSGSNTFNIPPGTERLAVSLNWDKRPGYDGSEGSEFALNLRRPGDP